MTLLLEVVVTSDTQRSRALTPSLVLRFVAISVLSKKMSLCLAAAQERVSLLFALRFCELTSST